MIQSVSDVDTGKHKIVFKWQLFTAKTINYLEPLSHVVFDYAYKFAQDLGYETTSSVFDDESLEYLQSHFSIPFLKIAGNPKYYPLLWHVKPELDKYVSITNPSNIPYLLETYEGMKIITLNCISKYPATMLEYVGTFGDSLKESISDHVEGTGLYKYYKPQIWEKHLKLEGTSDPFGDSFCVTAEELKGIL